MDASLERRGRNLKVWERAVSTGQFVLASVVLAGGMIGGWYRLEDRASIAEERISVMQQDSREMKALQDKRYDTITAYLKEIGERQADARSDSADTKAQVRVLVQLLSDGKRH